ncbi:MAG: 16S rRNA (guanine(966)-N(2))-methyltransferase RsmD [Bacteroidetes bacterium]|nr:16S rRNA (guanine(966)-N(2))-methyltransferase RsmD [Bacteroidota bacterium]MCL5267511.1 16S rRNA (guanine(966)-N(2))-methyltransferase RsmD [Bacteroidota bacterium]
MRITGGILGSRRLLSIDSPKLRPATDRLRETMFDILMNIMDFDGLQGLDLYAGTGSVGFEAISRGAEKVVFVEADRKIAEVLRKNAFALGIEQQCDVRTVRVEKFLKVNEDKFDIVFVDPPYALNNATYGIIDEILSRGAVSGNGIICVEHSKDYSPPLALLVRQKIFGSTILSFLKPETKCQN